MKLLITGGCGFLGANLGAEALRRGIHLIVLDNCSRAGSAANLGWLRQHGQFDFIHGDVRQAEVMERILRDHQPDAIFHAAGQVAMTTSIANPTLDFETNVVGSFNLLESVRRWSPDSLVVYSSTNKVYGALDQFTYVEHDRRYLCLERPEGFDESTALDFQSPYGCSKGAADQYFRDYARTFGLKTVVFRHSSMYGGRQFATFDQGWIGWFCQQALHSRQPGQKPFTIAGNGKQVRDVLHADDIGSLYFSAFEKGRSLAGEVFNVGGGMANSLSLLELFDLLEQELSVTLKYEQLPPRHSDQKVFVADIRKARRLLDWSPRVTAQAGISQMLQWLGTLSREAAA
jgi:CDP-paratose 2-epimerase